MDILSYFQKCVYRVGISSLCFLLYVHQVPAQSPSITRGPDDITAIVGQPLLLPCEVDGTFTTEKFRWKVDRKYEDDVIIYENGSVYPNMTDAYNVTGRFNLFIKEVKLTHAGKYTCSIDNNQRSGHVVVIEKPEIKFPFGELTDEDPYHTECVMRYAASNHEIDNAQFPRDRLMIGSDLVQGSTRTVTSLDDGTTGIRITASVIYRKAMAGKDLQCSISTENPEAKLVDAFKIRIKGYNPPSSGISWCISKEMLITTTLLGLFMGAR